MLGPAKFAKRLATSNSVAPPTMLSSIRPKVLLSKTRIAPGTSSSDLSVHLPTPFLIRESIAPLASSLILFSGSGFRRMYSELVSFLFALEGLLSQRPNVTVAEPTFLTRSPSILSLTNEVMYAYMLSDFSR